MHSVSRQASSLSTFQQFWHFPNGGVSFDNKSLKSQIVTYNVGTIDVVENVPENFEHWLISEAKKPFIVVLT